MIAGCLAFVLEVAEEAARAQHVHQQEMYAGEDVVLILGPHIKQLAEIVQGDGRPALSRIVQLEIRCRNSIVGGKHPPHDLGRDGGLGHYRADQREKQDLALEDGLQADSARNRYDRRR